jgi:HSP20 family protein
MAETVTKLPIGKEKPAARTSAAEWQPIESLRQEIDRLFGDFGLGSWQPFRRSLFTGRPLLRRELTLGAMPACLAPFFSTSDSVVH